jgi:hypothetical protein
MWERAPREPAPSEAEGFSRAQRGVGSADGREEMFQPEHCVPTKR